MELSASKIEQIVKTIKSSSLRAAILAMDGADLRRVHREYLDDAITRIQKVRDEGTGDAFELELALGRLHSSINWDIESKTNYANALDMLLSGKYSGVMDGPGKLSMSEEICEHMGNYAKYLQLAQKIKSDEFAGFEARRLGYDELAKNLFNSAEDNKTFLEAGNLLMAIGNYSRAVDKYRESLTVATRNNPIQPFVKLGELTKRAETLLACRNNADQVDNYLRQFENERNYRLASGLAWAANRQEQSRNYLEIMRLKPELDLSTPDEP